MRKNFQRAGVMLLTTALTLSSIPISALADVASKTNQLISSAANRYEVTVSVPGTESSLYNEIIIMIDRSGCQPEGFEEIKNMILQVGESVLNSTGNMKVTLMSFDTSGHTVIEKAGTYEQLAKTVADLSLSDMYDGLDVTNCEAGFAYISDYIDASPDLNKSYVFYISNGEASASEEPLVWDEWDTDEYGYMREKKDGDYFKKVGDVWVPNRETSYTVDEVIEITMRYEVKNFYHNGNFDGTLAPATTEIFGDAFDECLANVNLDAGSADEDKKNIDDQDIYEFIKPLLKEDPDQDGITLGKEWIDLVWEQVYDAADMTIGVPYAYSEVERAFDEYDQSSNQTWPMSFFYATYGYKAHFDDIHSDYTLSEGSWYHYRYKKGQRAAIRAMELSENEKIETLYLLGVGLLYGGSCYGSWMMPTEENKANQTAYIYAEGDKIESQVCGNIVRVCEQLKDYVEEIAITPYHDVVVTDYTGEGVTLLPETIKVYDGNYVICYFNKEKKVFSWTPGVTPLTESVPITVEMVDSAVAKENAEHAGYKITWNVKDGALLSSDGFRLCYEVIVEGTGEKALTSEVRYYDPAGVLHNEELGVLMEAVPVSSAEGSHGMIAIEDNDTPLGVYEIDDMETPLGSLPVIDAEEKPATIAETLSSVVAMVSTGVDILLSTGYRAVFGGKTMK